MINVIKTFFEKMINKVKRARENRWIVKNGINTLGRCFKYETDTNTIYVKLVAIDTYANEFSALCVTIPNNIEPVKLLINNKYGTYASNAALPYENFEMHIEKLDAMYLEDNLGNEISNDEFCSAVSSLFNVFIF